MGILGAPEGFMQTLAKIFNNCVSVV